MQKEISKLIKLTASPFRVFSIILFFHRYNRNTKVLVYRCIVSKKSYTRGRGEVFAVFPPTYFLLTHLFF